MDSIEVFARLGIAFVLGAIIGAERQWEHRTAGLATNTLVTVGAAAFTLMAADAGTADAPGRVIGQIISGIGFLGGGVIMRDGPTVHGLSTAATIWCSAGVGAFAALGRWAEAVMATCIMLVTNLALGPLGKKIAARTVKDPPIERDQRIVVRVSSGQEPTLRRLVSEAVVNLDLELSSFTSHLRSGQVEVVIEVAGGASDARARLVGQIIVEVDGSSVVG